MQHRFTGTIYLMCMSFASHLIMKREGKDLGIISETYLKSYIISQDDKKKMIKKSNSNNPAASMKIFTRVPYRVVHFKSIHF